MKVRNFVQTCLAITLSIPLASGSHADTLEWRRQADFTSGGSNPSSDTYGTPVWQYEWLTGGSLTSADPWWDNPTTLMVWDPDWWGRGRGAWSRGDNVSPMIDENLLTHNLYTISFPYMPLARWTNPLPGDTDFTISGKLKVVWNGPGDIGSPTLVDIVYGFVDADTNVPTILSSWTIDKPIPTDSVLDHVFIPISETRTFSQGDSLFWTIRAHDTFAPYGRWIEMWDLVRIRTDVVPAPATLICLAIIPLTRRRRGHMPAAHCVRRSTDVA